MNSQPKARGELLKQIETLRQQVAELQARVGKQTRAQKLELEIEKRFQHLIESNIIGILVADLKGSILEANNFFLNLTGFTRNDLEARKINWLKLTPPEYRSLDQMALDELFASGSCNPYEKEFIRKDGKRAPVLYGASIWDAAPPNPIWVGFCIDNSHRRRMEKEREELLTRVEELADSLAEESDLLRTIMENTDTQLAYFDPDFNFVRVNSAYIRGCGHRAEELIGKYHFDLFPNAENQAIFEQVRATGKPVRYHDKPFVFADQPERGITYWDWLLTPVIDISGALQGLVFSLHETTDRKRAEDALQKAHDQLEVRVAERTAELASINERLSREILRRKNIQEALQKTEENYRNSLDSSPLGIRIISADSEQLYVNKALLDIYGYSSAEEMANTPIEQRFTPQSYAEHLLRREKRRRGEPTEPNYEISIVRKSGAVRHLLVYRKEVIWNGEINFQNIYQDITDQKRMEQALRRSQDSLVRAQQIAHLGNWEYDLTNNFFSVSDEVYRIIGLEPGETQLELTGLLNIIHPEDREYVRKAVLDMLKEGRPASIEHRIIRPDGVVRYIHEDTELVFDSSGKIVQVLGTVHDITFQKESEAKLRALSNRLVQVQEEERRNIARELHDQIGQTLTVLKLMIDKSLSRTGTEDVRPILSEAQSLANELLAQARNMSLELRPSMLDDLGLLPTLLWHFDRYTAKTQVRVNFEHNGLQRVFPPAISITAFRIIQEALTNVVRHAHVSEVSVSARVDSSVLELCVTDNGPGFEPERLPIGASSGIYGMQERARLLGGDLRISSRPGSGTTIVAQLPLPSLS